VQKEKELNLIDFFFFLRGCYLTKATVTMAMMKREIIQCLLTRNDILVY